MDVMDRSGSVKSNISNIWRSYGSSAFCMLNMITEVRRAFCNLPNSYTMIDMYHKVQCLCKNIDGLSPFNMHPEEPRMFLTI